MALSSLVNFKLKCSLLFTKKKNYFIFTRFFINKAFWIIQGQFTLPKTLHVPVVVTTLFNYKLFLISIFLLFS